MGNNDYQRDLKAKLDYTFPDGDVPAVSRRVTSIFRADASSYTVGNGGTAQAKLQMFSNEMVADFANSYLRGYLALEISGAGAQIPQGQYTYETIRPLLPNGFESLIRDLRIESRGRAELEEIKNYNHVAHARHQRMTPKGNDNVLNRLCLRGDCLSTGEARAFVTNVPGDGGKSIVGIPFCVQLEGSGLLRSKRYFPLRACSELVFIFDFESPANAFHQELNYSLNNVDWNYGNSAGVLPTSAANIASQLGLNAAELDTVTGRVHPPQGIVDPNAATINLAYTISNLEFVVDMVALEPAFEMAMVKSVQGEGLPFWFDTYHVQSDPVTSQNFTQRIGKGAANVMRVHTKFQHQMAVGNQNEDTFRSEPFGISSYQYRLGTTYYPRDAVQNHLHMVLECDKAWNNSVARDPMPLSTIKKQIGSSFVVSQLNGVVGTATQQTKGASASSMTQVYLPDRESIPSQFMIGTSLMASPDAIISGVNTNNGHQLELFVQRYAPMNSLVTVPLRNSTVNDAVNSSLQVFYTRQPNTANAVGGLPRQSRYSWASGDPIYVISMLQYTRALVIRPNYTVQIRE